MDYSYFFIGYKVDLLKLMAYGFTKEKHTEIDNKNDIQSDIYSLSKSICNDDFLLKILIDGNKIFIDLYDINAKCMYQPFYLRDFNCKFIVGIRQRVNDILLDIKEKCFINCDIIENIKEFIYKEFNVTHETPWGYNKGSTFKTRYNLKWFALLINIPSKSIGMDNDCRVNIINLKVEPNKMEDYLKRTNIKKAYHMNKKHWISYILDENSDLEFLYHLIMDSYNLVNDKKAKK